MEVGDTVEWLDPGEPVDAWIPGRDPLRPPGVLRVFVVGQPVSGRVCVREDNNRWFSVEVPLDRLNPSPARVRAEKAAWRRALASKAKRERATLARRLDKTTERLVALLDKAADLGAAIRLLRSNIETCDAVLGGSTKRVEAPAATLWGESVRKVSIEDR